MCSIFGYVARGKSAICVQTLESIIHGNVQRGPHSFGFSWIDANGRQHCFKQAGRLTDRLGVLAMMRGARMMIGHLRYATHGDPSKNINNHPHPADGGWIVHNGVVQNYRELVRGHNLYPVSQCDSESIGLMIEQSASGSLPRRCADAVESTEGGLCVMGLWARPSSLVVARRGNPLHMSEGADGVYLATLSKGLPGKVVSLADDSIRVFKRDGGSIKVRRMELESREEVGGLFDADGEYAGG